MFWYKEFLYGFIVISVVFETLDARHIKKWPKNKKVASDKKQSSAIKTKREEIAGELEIDGNKFQGIGCYRDAWNRVLPALEGEHQLLMEPNYKARKYALLKCARAAADKQLKVFGIENGGQCFGAEDEKSLNKYGMAVECKGDGKGGPWSLQAYKFKDLPIDGDFTDWSAWTTCSKTCSNGVRRRMRTCTNPPPSNGGKDCSGLGPSVEGEICKDKECPTVLVDDAEIGNPLPPTLSTTRRNTAVPAAATYRPTIASVKTDKSREKGKVSIGSENKAKTLNQNDEPQESGENNHSVSKTEKASISGVDQPLIITKEAQGEQSQESKPNAHAPVSVPFEQLSEPDQAFGHGNLMPPMDQSGHTKPHGPMNEHHVPTGIDPSIVEDTYNGGPVVSSNAVQLNTPLGPVVMGEVSPVSAPYNSAEQQNDEQPPDDCFCPKKVCNAKADVGFLVDGSSDIPQVYFAHVLDFVKALAKGFEPRDTKVSLVAYGDDAATAFSFSPITDVHEIDDRIDAVSYMGGDPRTGNALAKFKDGVFKMYSRKDAEHALVLLTSGSSADDTNQAAAELRNAGVKMTTVGLGKLANVKELIDISSEPKSSHVFTAFLDTLPDLLDDIVKGVCSDVKGTLADRSDKCSCDAKKDPNKETMHEQPMHHEPGMDSVNKPSHEPSNALPQEHEKQPAEANHKPNIPSDSELSPVGGQSEGVQMKVDQLSLTLRPESQDKQKPPNQQSPETESQNKEASQEQQSSASIQETSQPDIKPEESKQGAHVSIPDQQAKEKEPKESAPISATDQQTETNPKETKPSQGANTVESSQQTPQTDPKVKQSKQESSSSAHSSSDNDTSSEKTESSKVSGMKLDSKLAQPAPEPNKNEPGVPKEDERNNNFTSLSSLKALKQSEKAQNSQEKAPESVSGQNKETSIENVESSSRVQPNDVKQTLTDKDNAKLESNKPQASEESLGKGAGTSESATTTDVEGKGSKENVGPNPLEKQGNKEEKSQALLQNSPAKAPASNSSKSAPPEKILTATESSSKPLPLNATKQDSAESHPENNPDHEHPSQSKEEAQHHGGKINTATQVEGPPPNNIPQSTGLPSSFGQEIQQKEQSLYEEQLKENQQPVTQASQALHQGQAGVNGMESEIQGNGEQQYPEMGPGEYIKQTPQQVTGRHPPMNGNTQPAGEACSVNLGVVLDSKTTAYGDDSNAQKLLLFAKRLTHIFPVSPEGNRVGMMVYSGSPKLKVVHFDHSLDQHTMDKAIDSASYLNMEIKTGRVLNFAQQHLFSRIPSGKQNVLLLITDGVSYDDVTRPALELKRRGIEIFVIGVGRNVVRNELESIASEPADDHVIMTSYDFSDALLEDVKNRICSSAQRREKITSPSSPLHANCGKADVGFLIEGSRTVEDPSQGNFQKILEFVKNVSMTFPVSLGKVRIGAVVYGTEPSLEIPFNNINSSDGVPAAFDSIRYPGTSSMTGRALEFARHNLFSYPNTRRGVPKVLVVITQGSSEDDVRKPSEDLHRDGVEVLSVGLGSIYDRVELENMSSLPVSEHVLTTDYPELSSQVEELRKMICKISRNQDLEI